MASLLSLSRAAFQRSKQNDEWKQRIRVTGFVGALLGVVLPATASTISSLLAVCALVLEVTAWWFSREASKAHRLAEQARRSSRRVIILRASKNMGGHALKIICKKAHFGRNTFFKNVPTGRFDLCSLNLPSWFWR
jgi:hypothetical protein